MSPIAHRALEVIIKNGGTVDRSHYRKIGLELFGLNELRRENLIEESGRFVTATDLGHETLAKLGAAPALQRSSFGEPALSCEFLTGFGK